MTLNMNSGMKGDVGGAGLGCRARYEAGVEYEFSNAVIPRFQHGWHGVGRAARGPSESACVGHDALLLHAVNAALEILQRVGLATTERPRICSEGDVKHGFGGDMQRSSGAPLPRCPTSAFRRCLACC